MSRQKVTENLRSCILGVISLFLDSKFNVYSSSNRSSIKIRPASIFIWKHWRMLAIHGAECD